VRRHQFSRHPNISFAVILLIDGVERYAATTGVGRDLEEAAADQK
jgi:hypothetical protein